MTFKRLAICPSKFKRLDRKLAVARGNMMSTGWLSRRVDIERKRAADRGRLPSGRQMLRMLKCWINMR
jgi:hypothetical protein